MSQPDTEPETQPDTLADTHRMLITVEYDGTGLVGWQRQNNGPSVQAYLEAAAEKLTSRKTPIQGSGRTDAGVHASAQAAHLDVPKSLNTNAVVNGLNAWLDCPQVSVLTARRVGQDFNARFDATERSYLYRILDRRTSSALRRHHVWHHRTKLNVDAMQEAAEDESSVKRRRRSADLHHAGSAQIPMPSPSQSNEEKEDKQTAAPKQQQQEQQQKHQTQQQ